MRYKVCARQGCFNVFEDDHGRKYCCANCRSKAWYKNQVDGLGLMNQPTKKNCRNCGKYFTANNPLQQYCSGKCKQQHYRERRDLISVE